MNKITKIWPTKSGFATEGVFRIDHIGTGVGILLFHRQARVAGGLHVFRGKAEPGSPPDSTQYADTGIAFLLSQLRQWAPLGELTVTIAGGAGMLSGPECVNFGPDLLEEVRSILAREKLSIDIEETGGSKVRSIVLDIDRGEIAII